MKSQKARKQRKYLYTAPLHMKRKWLASHLQENLLLKYDRRSLPVIKGDTVKIMRGSFKGHEDKISRVNVKDQYVEVEGVTLIKSDGKKVAKPIHASNLIITKLNLTDVWRRKKLEKGLAEETKKEIEKEAQQQLKELEEQKKQEQAKKEEEERQKEDAEKAEAAEETKPLSSEEAASSPQTLQPEQKPVEQKKDQKPEKKPAAKKEKKEAEP